MVYFANESFQPLISSIQSTLQVVAPEATLVMSNDVKQRMTVLKRLKAATLEVVRRSHLAVPTFLDLYAGRPKRPGPIFAKEAQVLHALTRLVMPSTIVEIGVGGAASTLA